MDSHFALKGTEAPKDQDNSTGYRLPFRRSDVRVHRLPGTVYTEIILPIPNNLPPNKHRGFPTVQRGGYNPDGPTTQSPLFEIVEILEGDVLQKIRVRGHLSESDVSTILDGYVAPRLEILRNY